jgi:hypothetical protein
MLSRHCGGGGPDFNSGPTETTMDRSAALAISILLAILPSSSAGAANLIENGGFDDDTAGWLAHTGTAIGHAVADELGSPVSGSIELGTTALTQTGVGAYQCVPVVPGRTYAFGASARIPVGQPVNAAFVSVSWSTQANCGVLNLEGDSVLPYFMELRGAWGTTQRWETAPPGALGARLSLNANKLGDQPANFRVAFDNVFFLEDATCGPSATSLCLNDGRFRVIVEFATKAGVVGLGHAIPLTDDSGYFWFFNSANVEIVTKVLDACDTQFDTFWVFAAGLTNVETTIRVHDTLTDTEKVYVNPQETPFAPIQDTEAFHTCPMLGG